MFLYPPVRPSKYEKFLGIFQSLPYCSSKNFSSGTLYFLS